MNVAIPSLQPNSSQVAPSPSPGRPFFRVENPRKGRALEEGGSARAKKLPCDWQVTNHHPKTGGLEHTEIRWRNWKRPQIVVFGVFFWGRRTLKADCCWYLASINQGFIFRRTLLGQISGGCSQGFWDTLIFTGWLLKVRDFPYVNQKAVWWWIWNSPFNVHLPGHWIPIIFKFQMPLQNLVAIASSFLGGPDIHIIKSQQSDASFPCYNHLHNLSYLTCLS